MKDDLERVPLPAADAAQDRAGAVVLAAFAERERVPQTSRWHPLVVVTALVGAALVLAVASPPGRAVIDRVREAVGIERAQPALYSLPAPGRMLVSASGSLWVVQADGSRRRLGAYRQGSWSPFGRFVVATRANELSALEPDGTVRWTLARPGPADAVWAGTKTDTRIAYVDRSGIRVVAGDGTGDRLLAPAESGPVAWRPGVPRQLATVSGGVVRVHDVDTGRVVWRATRGTAAPVLALEWSSDGKRLLVLSAHALRVYDERGRIAAHADRSAATRDADAAFRPGTHEVAVIRVAGAESSVVRLGAARARQLFNGTGVLDQVVWSPDGRVVLVTWPTADQWVFVPARGRSRHLRAAANVTAQFRAQAFPRVEGWCCAH